MLREITISIKEDGEYHRRWYEDDRMDLFVWFDAEEGIVRFQLAYDKYHSEKAINWRRGQGFTHSRIDDGANIGHHPSTPLMTGGGVFAKDRVLTEFQERATDIDASIAAFVLNTLREFPDETRNRGLKKKAMAIGALIGGLLIAWRLWK